MKNEDENANKHKDDSPPTSDSFVLNINSQKSLTNPYDQSNKSDKANPVNKEPNDFANLVIFDYPISSKFWIILSLIFTSLYYGIVVFLNLDFISTKIYQSFSIGFLIPIDNICFSNNSNKEESIDKAFNSFNSDYNQKIFKTDRKLTNFIKNVNYK